jgi:hypothetical protein
MRSSKCAFEDPADESARTHSFERSTSGGDQRRPEARGSDSPERLAPLMTTTEVARLLHYHPRSIRNKIRAGVFREGEHFVRPPRSQLRWLRAAVLAFCRAADSGGVTEEGFRLASRGGRDLI